MSAETHPAGRVVFLAAAAGLVCLCLAMLRPFAGVLAWSVVLAITCYPLRERLARKTGRVALSAFITSLAAVFAFVIPLLVLGGVALTQSLALRHAIRAAFESPDQSLARTAAAIAAFTGRLGVDQDTMAGWLRTNSTEWMRNAAGYTTSFAVGLLEAIASSLFVIVSLFLLLRDGERIVDAFVDLLPFGRPRSERLLRRIGDAVQASVNGVVVMALINGVVYCAAFWLLGVPSPALWGMVTVFASVFPLVGAFAVWGPAAVYLAVHGHWPQVVLLAVTAALASAIDHVLRPRLVAGRLGLSELAMFFALLGGVAVFGALGVVLGPAAFAALAAIIDTLREPAVGREILSGRRAVDRPDRRPSR
jgi:predicted PurR-regulated permease PerM